jgi:hypothetical protein
MIGVTLFGLLLMLVYASVRWVVAKVNGGHKLAPDLGDKIGESP